MSSYTGTADRPDRAKAIAAVVAVHVALGVAILTGLNVSTVRAVAERLQTIDIRMPPPPPPVPPPPPAPRPKQPRLEEGAVGKKAEPSPIVAPTPRIPVQSPLPAAPVAGTGNATTAGAANSGTGTGAGGSGSGTGGGGTGGFTPAQQISKIPDAEYRRLASVSGMERGMIGVSITANPDGSASNCRVIRSSGSLRADALMCRLTEQYVRFRPARDPYGRAVGQQIIWYPYWQQRLIYGRQ
jgi:protein TonB